MYRGGFGLACLLGRILTHAMARFDFGLVDVLGLGVPMGSRGLHRYTQEPLHQPGTIHFELWENSKIAPVDQQCQTQHELRDYLK